MSGEPLLFIPDLNCTADLFAPQARILMAGRRCATAQIGRFPDLRMEAFAILGEAPEQFALAGSGLGAFVAFEIIRQAPQRVTRLALVAAKSGLDIPEEHVDRERLMGLASESGVEAAHADQWPRLVHPSRREDADLEALVLKMARDTGAARFACQQTALMNRMPYQTVVSAIRVPTLFIAGDADEIAPPSIARNLAARIRGAEVVVIRDCGHLAAIERPSFVTSQLQRWLERTT